MVCSMSKVGHPISSVGVSFSVKHGLKCKRVSQAHSPASRTQRYMYLCVAPSSERAAQCSPRTKHLELISFLKRPESVYCIVRERLCALTDAVHGSRCDLTVVRGRTAWTDAYQVGLLGMKSNPGLGRMAKVTRTAQLR